MTRTTMPPLTELVAGITAYTAAEDVKYSNSSPDPSSTSSFVLTYTAAGPPSLAGDAHSTPYPAARLVNGPMDPKRQLLTTTPSIVLRSSRTTVPPTCGPSRGFSATTIASSTYSYTIPLWLNVCPSPAVLNSSDTRPGACEGASHFTSAEDTTSASTGSDDPNPHSAPSPMRCVPATFTTPTPAVGPEAGCTDSTTASDWYVNSILLVLNPPCAALTSSVTTPGACGGAMHITSTHPMHRAARTRVMSSPPSTATVPRASPTHSSSPPTYSPGTISSPKRHCTESPCRPLPMTSTIAPPETEVDVGLIANTSADVEYPKITSDVSHTSSFELILTDTAPPSWAGVAHSAPPPPRRLASGPTVPKRHATLTGASGALNESLTTVPPLWGPSRGSTPTTEISSVYSNLTSLWLSCCPSSFMLSSTTTVPGLCAGASHLTSADETRPAVTSPSKPIRQYTS